MSDAVISLGLPPRKLWDAGEERRILDAYSEIAPALPPYDHQRRVVNEAIPNLESIGYHAFFMEMGTGKTKVTIDSFMVEYARGKVDCLIVIAPKALVSTWRDDELPKHMNIPYRAIHWDRKASKKSQADFDSLFSEKRAPVYIVNVEAFQSLNELLRTRLSKLLRTRKVFWAVDESSTLKGPDAKRSKAVKAGAKLATMRVILTGTEISKSPLDLYMQFEVLKHGFWGAKSFFIFRSKYAILEDGYGPGGRTFKKVAGYTKLNELTASIEHCMSRAMKKDCLDLPEKIRVTIKVDFTPAQERVYGELKKYLATLLASGEMMTVENKISLFAKFRQITGGTMKNGEEVEIIESYPGKLEALITDVEDTDEQIIVWAAFRAEIDLIAKALSPYGKVITFDGSTSIEERDEGKRAFQAGEARFFVANMKTGAYGLNLQNCHIQYFYSRDTSPQVNWQAEDRSHRPGQKYPCVYKSLVVKDSVDERIVDLLSMSKDLLDIIQNGGADVFTYV